MSRTGRRTRCARLETMTPDLPAKTKPLAANLLAFMDEHIYPSESVFARELAAQESRWQVPPVVEALKNRARAAGLWNLFLPESELGAGLSNEEYAPLCEIM